MTIVGEPSRFAAEFSRISRGNDVEHWKFGHFRFWAAGVPIGRFAEQESLSAICASLKELLKSKGRRENLALFEQPAKHLLAVTKEALFGEAATEASALESWQKYGGLRALDP